ncbi:MAG: potassium transporter [Proteobacteria bacterium]|nr:MAG: potassium transporter [Pseudomonadota bacterium]PIE66835.1 MAG: potassium transporter [Deltaproteobacteria bacterium]
MVDDKQQSVNLNGLNRFWIVGAGRFGSLAVERIACGIPDASMTVLDSRRPAIDYIDEEKATLIREDGISWLVSRFRADAPVDMIVPAIPVHLVFEWLKAKLSDKFDFTPIQIPAGWLDSFPNPMPGNTGQVYVSHANFICPDNCPEPEAICTHTGKPRPMDLFRLLAGLDFDGLTPIVIRSHQLLPGVGGILPTELMNALVNALNWGRSSDHRILMIATACRCHGVVDFIRLENKDGDKV